MQNKRVFGLMTAAGCALFAASVMGVVSDSFEGQTAGDAVTTITGWEGYGTVTATTYSGSGDSTVGRPIVQANASPAPANVLAVEGRVTRTAATTANNAATVDMMVQIALPDDDLAFPSGTTTTDIQIAVGVDKVSGSETTGALKVWCTPRAGGDPAWIDLGVTYTKDTWHRVSFTFDYANQLCQIRVDGDPIITANGILAAGSTMNGAWYRLAAANKTALASVQIIGSTSIDDMLVTDAATVKDALPVLADSSGLTGGVPNSWIEEQGITRSQATTGSALDESGMTIEQKYRTGLSVADGQVFAITDMTMSGSTATLTVPTATAATGYANKIQYSTDKTNWTDADVTASGTVTVNVNPGNAETPPAVIYVRLVNKTAAN